MREHATERDAARARILLAAGTALAVPSALGAEYLARRWWLPPTFHELVEPLRGAMTKAAWVLGGLAALAVVFGPRVLGSLRSRARERLSAEARANPSRVARSDLGTFLVASSLAQVPGLLVGVCFFLGAEGLPVVVTVLFVTVAILRQAAALAR